MGYACYHSAPQALTIATLQQRCPSNALRCPTSGGRACATPCIVFEPATQQSAQQGRTSTASWWPAGGGPACATLMLLTAMVRDISLRLSCVAMLSTVQRLDSISSTSCRCASLPGCSPPSSSRCVSRLMKSCGRAAGSAHRASHVGHSTQLLSAAATGRLVSNRSLPGGRGGAPSRLCRSPMRPCS